MWLNFLCIWALLLRRKGLWVDCQKLWWSIINNVKKLYLVVRKSWVCKQTNSAKKGGKKISDMQEQMSISHCWSTLIWQIKYLLELSKAYTTKDLNMLLFFKHSMNRQHFTWLIFSIDCVYSASTNQYHSADAILWL